MVKMKINLLIILLVIASNNNAQSQRVLFVSIPSLSHFKGLLSIGRILVEHHQNITISFAVFDEFVSYIHEKLPNSSVIPLGPLPKSNTKPHFCVKDHEHPLQFMSRVSLPGFLSLYQSMHARLVAANIAVNFDLLVINMFAFAAQDLAHDLRVPFVIHSCTSVEGVFSLPAWIPRGFDSRTPDDLQSSFFARLDNYLIEPLRMAFYLGPHMVELDRLRRHANRTTQGIHPILGNPVQRWQNHPILIPYPIALDFHRPYTPNYHFLGFVLDEQDSNKQYHGVSSYNHFILSNFNVKSFS